jgi:hypothetical protein
MLRNELPFQPLRLHALRIIFAHDADEASLLAVAADLTAHASLQRADLFNAPLDTPAALEAVVNVALARQFTFLGLWYCHLSPVSAPALVRLLGTGTLTELHICQIWDQILDGPSATQVGNALRANSTLTSFMCVPSIHVARHGRGSCAAWRTHGPPQPAQADLV